MADAPRPSRDLLLVLSLLTLGAVPDGMVYPALRALTVERYDITIDRASWFTLVPTLGAIAFAFVLPKIVRGHSPLTVLRIASLVEALLLASVALPVPYWLVIVLRFLAGACDLAGIAATLRIAVRIAGERHRGWAMGAMGTAIMLGLFIGFGFGAVLSVPMILPMAAMSLLVLTVLSFPIERAVPRVHDADPPSPARGAISPALRRSRVAASMMLAGDRGLSAVLSLVVPLAFGGRDGSAKSLVGAILGLSMLGMVIGGPFGGHLVDRFGAVPVRLVGALLFGFGTLGIVLVAPVGPWAMIAMAAIAGLGAAPLFASAMAIGTQQRGGTGVYGAIQAAGQGGYALGGASLLFAQPAALGAAETLAVSAITYIALTLAMTVLLRGTRITPT